MNDQETWRIGPGPTTRIAQRREARRRQRRRWAIGSVAGLACLAVLVTYLGPDPDPAEPDLVLPAGAPTPAGYPTGATGVGVSGEAGVAAPGLQPRERTPPPPSEPPTPTATPAASPAAPTLSVSRAEVPAEVDLTALGARDWVHWGLNRPETLIRKNGGTGEIRDEGGRGARDRYDTNPELFGWRDGAGVPAVSATATGVFVCGVGNGFALAVTGDGEPRTVHLFAGTWMAQGRLDVRLSTGGATRTLRLEDPHTTHTAQFVIRYRVPRGEQLLIRWTVEKTFNSSCGNVNLQAAAVR
ncbi:hypothetical protein [Micromonospora antibiotica]|uniref:hypothetical protein n=1 Tax=Micromonospora antibiotica TaxID=2807623 RepID=UPI0027DC37CF|nr:hypothetical protein [Micromonospora antibiotica]